MNASPLKFFRPARSVLWAIGAFVCVLMMMLLMARASDIHKKSIAAPVSFIQDESATDVPGEENTDQTTESTIKSPSYVARAVELTDGGFDPLGDLDDIDQRTALTFTQLGAGIESLQLPDEFETVAGNVHVTLQAKIELENSTKFATPFAAMSVKINGTIVDLSGWNYPIWSQVSAGVFEAHIDDIDGNPVVRLERRFTLKPNKQHGFYLAETIENLSNKPINASLVSSGAIDMPKADSSYGGDRRRVRYGFLLPQEQQATSLTVTVDEELKNRNKLLGKKIPAQYGKAYPDNLVVWPNEEVLNGAQRLSWLGLTDRYFVVAMHPQFAPASIQTAEEKLFTGFTMIDRLMLDTYANQLDAVQVLRLIGEEHAVAPGESVTNTIGVYAGPRNRPLMNAEPEIASLNMPTMVVSNLGGICAPCTFSWLTDILIGVLRTFHSIVGDWAVSILLLVVLVRGCLHPVTRWSQIRVQRFSVQMQEMAPKQKAIREKYKNDSKRQQQEMGKLWKEEGISPAGMLGCLPMFLQSPVWIALYATLFFASELRHEPAFYGVFQNVMNWQFMNDLSAPDGAIPLPASMHFSFAMWGTVNSINILPLLLGVVFYLHQKYLTPPTQATLTPEQESQQKMMKIMMVFMFPVMMYAAPSGLALYFITNSTMGIVENKWIRAHMKKHGMLEIENIRAAKKDKGPGFLQRMTEAAEAQKQLKEKGPAHPNPASKHNRRGKM
jgi:YidC/Oxa1 family membrane protein insertase